MLTCAWFKDNSTKVIRASPWVIDEIPKLYSPVFWINNNEKNP